MGYRKGLKHWSQTLKHWTQTLKHWTQTYHFIINPYCKEHKRGIEHYIHFIQKPVILFAIILPSFPYVLDIEVKYLS